MPKYKYVARDNAGKSTTGQVEATDESELRRILRQNGLFLVQVKTRSEGLGGTGDPVKEDKAPQGFFDTKATLQDLVIATRQMSTMMRSGLPMMESLALVGSQTTKPILRYVFKDLERAVSSGQSLSLSMAKYPKVFSTLLVAFVESGEATGNLDGTLEAAAIQLDREDNLKRKVKAATTYPKIVVAACVGTVAVMLLLVVPVFATVYKSLKSELPAPTRLLIWVSDVGIRFGWFLLIPIGLGVYGYRWYQDTPGGKRRLDIIALKIPVLGPVFRKIAIARFVQTLSSALSSGVPILQSLTISSNTSGNTVIRDAVTEASMKIREGASIAIELERTNEFPMMVTRMIAAGESSGNLDAMLEEVSRYYERDVEYAVEKLTRMIEPLMTVLIGGIVLLILLALYMPVFNLGKAFQGAH
jgi:type IV pilus assembly protein PilC